MPQGRVEMRLAELEPGPGLVEARLRDGDSVVYLHEQVELVTTDFSDVQRTLDESGRPAITFKLTAQGAEKLSALTAANIGQTLAIVVDDVVIVAAKIQSRISSSGQITGSFTDEEVAKIVRAINGS